MGNMDLWNSFCAPPTDALSTIAGGNLAGKTDIKPQWRYKALTDTFGPCGIGWKWRTVERWTEDASEGQRMVFVRVEILVRDPSSGQWSEPIEGVGGDFLIEKQSKGLVANDEAVKMATTDAIGNAAKYLGVAANVYLGQLDSKYQRPAAQALPTKQSASAAPVASKPPPAPIVPAQSPAIPPAAGVAPFGNFQELMAEMATVTSKPQMVQWALRANVTALTAEEKASANEAQKAVLAKIKANGRKTEPVATDGAKT